MRSEILIFTVSLFGFLAWLVCVVYQNDVLSLPFQITLIPEFALESEKSRYLKNDNRLFDEYIVEKFTHEQQDGKDVRNGLYLTHHKYFLEQISKKTVEVQGRKFSLNDICVKPHRNIFQTWQPGLKKPNYVERLELEAKRLSPCLIVTPLNCFYDSYRLHSDISHWKFEVNYLNRRLRDSYLDARIKNENGTNPYVKADDGLTLIEKWSELMWQMAQKPEHLKVDKVPEEWIGTVRKWMKYMQPSSKMCADPIKSCDNYKEDDNYYNMCNDMNKFNDLDAKRDMMLEFGEEDSENQLDCVEDREKFIDWAQKRHLEDILQTLSPNRTSLHVPKYQEILSQSCSGIFRADIDFFAGRRLFPTAGLMNFEIVLLQPEKVLEQLQEKARVNKVDSIFQIEDAQMIVELLRAMFREEVKIFNEKLASKKFGVRTSVKADPRVDENSAPLFDIFSIIFPVAVFLVVVVAASTVFLWADHRIYSLVMFLLRFVLAFLVFSIFFSQAGTLIIKKIFMFYLLIYTIFNVVLTTVISRMKMRKRIRKNAPTDQEKGSIRSSLSNMSSVSGWSIQTLVRRFDRLIENVRVEKRALDNERMPDGNLSKWEKFRVHYLWIGFMVYFMMFWMFDEKVQIELVVPIVSSLMFFALEVGWVRWKNRQYKKILRRRLERSLENLTNSRQSLAVEARAKREVAVDRMEKKRGGGIESVEMVEMGKESHELTTPMSEMPLVPVSRRSSSRFEEQHSFVDRYVRIVFFYCFMFNLKLVSMKKKILVPIVGAIVAVTLVAISCLFTPFLYKKLDVELSKTGEDVFIDVKFNDSANNLKDRMDVLMKLTEQLETVPNFHPVSNWALDFRRFVENDCVASSFPSSPISATKQSCTKILNWNTSSTVEINRSFANVYPQWFRDDPIVASIVTTNGRPSQMEIQQENYTPNRFWFRLRYELLKSTTDEQDMAAVEKIVSIVQKLEDDHFLTVHGSFYTACSNFYRMWPRNAKIEVTSTIGILFLTTVFAKFAIPTLNPVLMVVFPIIICLVKLETAAFAWLLSDQIAAQTVVYSNAGCFLAMVVLGKLMFEMHSFQLKFLGLEFTKKMKGTAPMLHELAGTTMALAVLWIAATTAFLSSIFVPDALPHFLLICLIIVSITKAAVAVLIFSRRLIDSDIIHTVANNIAELRDTHVFRRMFFGKAPSPARSLRGDLHSYREELESVNDVEAMEVEPSLPTPPPPVLPTLPPPYLQLSPTLPPPAPLVFPVMSSVAAPAPPAPLVFPKMLPAPQTELPQSHLSPPSVYKPGLRPSEAFESVQASAWHPLQLQLPQPLQPEESSEEDVNSEGPMDEEVAGCMEQIYTINPGLRPIESNSNQGNAMMEDRKSIQSKTSRKSKSGSEKSGLGIGGDEEEEEEEKEPEEYNEEDELYMFNAPSTSTAPPPQNIIRGGNVRRHEHADYFTGAMTYEMVDFLTDEANRGGKPWVPPANKPTKEALDTFEKLADEAVAIVLAATPSDSENEEEEEYEEGEEEEEEEVEDEEDLDDVDEGVDVYESDDQA